MPPVATIDARVTVTLKGANPGDIVNVDPTDPFMRACFAQGILVATAAVPAAAPPPDPTAGE